MFNLETAVDEWCQGIGNSQGESSELKEELKDHLYCEIEALLEEGLSDQQAFSLATKKLGQPDALLDEYSKNRNIFSNFIWNNHYATGMN